MKTKLNFKEKLGKDVLDDEIKAEKVYIYMIWRFVEG